MEEERKFRCGADSKFPNMKYKQRAIHDIDYNRRVWQRGTDVYNCGVWVCTFAYCAMMGLPYDTFSARIFKFFRRHMACSIAKGKLVPLVSYEIS